MIRLILWCFFALSAAGAWAQQLQTKTFEQLEQAMQREPRPVVVFLHTDWCNYCALMERKTLGDPQVIARLNRDFYFVSFNAESKENIAFQEQTYQYKKKGLKSGVNELAEALMGSQAPLSYPSVVLLDPKFQKLFQYGAYLKSAELLELLQKIEKS